MGSVNSSQPHRVSVGGDAHRRLHSDPSKTGHTCGVLVDLAQCPPTAKGMGFLVLEDETGRLPVAAPPQLAEQMYRRIQQTRVVAVAGRVERSRWYRSLLAMDLREPSSPCCRKRQMRLTRLCQVRLGRRYGALHGL
jgi:DNA polymerase III alpha subunit